MQQHSNQHLVVAIFRLAFLAGRFAPAEYTNQPVQCNYFRAKNSTNLPHSDRPIEGHSDNLSPNTNHLRCSPQLTARDAYDDVWGSSAKEKYRPVQKVCKTDITERTGRFGRSERAWMPTDCTSCGQW